MAYVFLSQESMVVKKEDYTGIGKRGKDLVVFFSRLGYTRQVAYEEASRLGADLFEIKAKERTEGTLGFWWCGRYGMHSWPMEIEKIDKDVEKYESVTICSPVWVFGPAAPIREFLTENKGNIKKMRVVITDHSFSILFHEECNKENRGNSRNKSGREKKRRNKDRKNQRIIHNMIISLY